MIAKALGALALTLIPAAATPQAANYTDNPSVVQVVCRVGNMVGKGTAFRISKDYLVSVAHVTSVGNCTIKGQPFETVIEDGDLDFSLIRLRGDEPSMKIDCSGYHRGEMVFAVGHALGLPEKRILVLVAAGYKVPLSRERMFGLLLGNRVIPGQSGGPIVNSRNEAVGLVNAYSPQYNVSFSRELSDTPLCR